MTQTECRPVAQVHNPIKAPETVKWGVALNRLTRDRFSDFCLDNGWKQADVVDEALIGYMDAYERSQGAVHESHEENSGEEEEFDPFTDGEIPE